MHFLALWIMWMSWLAFSVFWLVTALRTKRVQKRESLAGRLGTFGSEAIGYTVLFWGLDWPGLSARVWPSSPICDALSIAAALGGLAVAIWARVTLSGNWSASITLKAEHELIERGPYRWVRHPIYTGILLLILANVLMVGRRASVLGLLLLILAYWRKWRIEERLMTSHFGARYASYRTRSGAVVPGW
jgi:protein-S-isoprenylcysteine O-methyltransferase Ste14